MDLKIDILSSEKRSDSGRGLHNMFHTSTGNNHLPKGEKTDMTYSRYTTDLSPFSAAVHVLDEQHLMQHRYIHVT